MQRLGVIYLYRFVEGVDPVRRFLASYRDHPAGTQHDLIVILKGFPDSARAALARPLFESVPAHFIELNDSGYDVGTYARAATMVSHARLIFFNTFSEILADNWLYHFDQALGLPGVGLVGATGSWQANTAVFEAAVKSLFEKVSTPRARLRGSRIHHGSGGNSSRQSPGSSSPHPQWHIRALRGVHPTPLLRSKSGDVAPRRYFLAPLDYCRRLYEYGRYPNPHIRTNAFMIERDRFLSLNSSRFTTKHDSYKFESGRDSMTKQIMKRGLIPLIVDRFGKTYTISDWKSSLTFWTNEQSNLMVADNRTMDYAKANRMLRREMENLAWIHPWRWSNSALLQAGQNSG